jgi:hypothetical protein
MIFQRFARYTAFAAVITSVVGVNTVLGPPPPPQLLGGLIKDGKLSLTAEKYSDNETIVNGIKHITIEDIAATGHRNLSSLNKRQSTKDTVNVGSKIRCLS